MRPSSVADLARRDPVIPGLGVVLDPDAFAAALHAANPEAAVRAARIVYVKYKPQSYCRVAYRLEGRSRSGCGCPCLPAGRSRLEARGSQLDRRVGPAGTRAHRAGPLRRNRDCLSVRRQTAPAAGPDGRGATQRIAARAFRRPVRPQKWRTPRSALSPRAALCGRAVCPAPRPWPRSPQGVCRQGLHPRQEPRPRLPVTRTVAGRATPRPFGERSPARLRVVARSPAY